MPLQGGSKVQVLDCIKFWVSGDKPRTQHSGGILYWACDKNPHMYYSLNWHTNRFKNWPRQSHTESVVHTTIMARTRSGFHEKKFMEPLVRSLPGHGHTSSPVECSYTLQIVIPMTHTLVEWRPLFAVNNNNLFKQLWDIIKTHHKVS